ncbi:ganglioside GM2 activator-like [Patiria miniata]|uniref:MD-2-related lipid-recognition domain-containing protein n=1 Tax=Patiria miniata TaxID=46514 RepID=A0A913ZZB6_PATMI|nr:ganglioside GM2 activator-like [Patiria miniata]
MNFSIYISTLCLVAAALVFEDAIAINIAGYASSSDCGSSSAPVKGSFSLNPTGPNSLSFSANLHIDEELESPLKAVVKIQAKVAWWWHTLSCYGDRFGSCTYQDVCQFLPASNSTSGSCPAPFQDLPSCQCPLRTGTYSAESEFVIPSFELPSYYWMSSGYYWAQIKLYKGYREVGCNEIYFNEE